MIRSRAVHYEDPYRVERLPLLSRLHRAAYRAAPSTKRKLLQYPLFKAFPKLYRLGIGGRGDFSLRAAGGPKRLSFDARNLQFSSLYMPQHESGYESETYALLDALLAPDGVFFDVGSNWGYYALALALRPGFSGRVHAFEPSARAFADLRALAAEAGLGERAGLHRCALSDRDGEAGLVIPDGIHGGSAAVSTAGGGETISLRRLDGFSLPEPTVVKIDAEDHEPEVLDGGRRVLSAARPFIVFESWLRASDPAASLRAFQAARALGPHAFFVPLWTPARAQLALVPFEPEQRFLLAEQLNVLACPAPRLPELEALFPETASFQAG